MALSGQQFLGPQAFLSTSKRFCLNFATVPEIHPDWTGVAHMTAPELIMGGQKEFTRSALGVHSQLWGEGGQM